ncbi:FxsA family protein [Rhabdothermincola salaria]|uniref:FxsA family protein n=1 Tax=Rhabdothermincola salaria TaxID=2903142 RepID=UPI001E4050AF|nr:FxsA family protein [Rhabdothermincola salaria]MCD9625392.1 FxsA family protein [Rhabdothermincola salaria]
MVGLLFVLFVVVPLVELYVIVAVASEIGALPTIALLLVISFAGAWLVRREGIGVLRRTQATLQSGDLPAREMVDGALLLAAGSMLVVPGFVTDALGLLLVVPPVRALLRNRLIRRWERRSGLAAGGLAGRGRIVDVEFVGDVTPTDRPSDDGPPPLGGGR